MIPKQYDTPTDTKGSYSLQITSENDGWSRNSEFRTEQKFNLFESIC